MIAMSGNAERKALISCLKFSIPTLLVGSPVADHIVIDEGRSDQFIHKVEISPGDNLVEHSAHNGLVCFLY